MKTVILLALLVSIFISVAEANILGRRPTKLAHYGPARTHHHERVLMEHHGPAPLPHHHTTTHTVPHARVHAVPSLAAAMHGHPHAKHAVRTVHKEIKMKTTGAHPHLSHPIRGHPKLALPSKIKPAGALLHHTKPHSHPRHAHVHVHGSTHH